MKFFKKGVWLVLLINFGCSSKQHQESSELNQSSKTVDIRKDIQGVWATSDTANISFKVRGDSLYFFEDPNPVFFDIRKDSFIYFLSGEKYFNKILKIDKDSIVFIENGETIRLYKRL